MWLGKDSHGASLRPLSHYQVKELLLMENKSAASKAIPGVVKVTDNIYKVDINLIVSEPSDIGADEENLRFFNPRSVEMNPDSEINGFMTAQIDALKSSIKSTGLLNPLLGRFKDNKVSLIEGHRRWVALNQLVEEDAPCYDSYSGATVPASTLYNFVLMRVYDQGTSEEDCFSLSFQEDKTKVKFGAGAEIRFVHHCLMRGIPDAKIMEILEATPEWLKETKNMIRSLEDDESILQALFNDGLNRTAAKSLAEVEDFDERHEIFRNAMDEAKTECEGKIHRIQRSISNIDNKIDIVKTKKIISEHTGAAEPSDRYDDEIEELSAAKKDLETKILETSPVVNPEAVRKGAAKAAKSGVARPKTASSRIAASERISSKWRKFFTNLQSRPQIGDEEVDKEFVDMCLDFMNCCTDKDSSPEDFARKWGKIS